MPDIDKTCVPDLLEAKRELLAFHGPKGPPVAILIAIISQLVSINTISTFFLKEKTKYIKLKSYLLADPSLIIQFFPDNFFNVLSFSIANL